MLVTEFLKNSSGRFPDKPVIICGSRRLTYAELDSLSDIYARKLLQKGVRTGDRAVLFFDNGCEYLVSFFGILKCGAIAVPLHTQLLSDELLFHMNDCSPAIIATDAKHSRMISEAIKTYKHQAVMVLCDIPALQEAAQAGDAMPLVSAQCNAENCAVILYTSGTTGMPKGVMLSHENLSSNADSIIEYAGLTSEDKVIVILPFYYAYGTSLLTTHIKAGGTLVIDNRFMYPNVILDTMEKEGVTGFAGVPSHYIILLKISSIRKYRFPALRYAMVAGGALSPVLINEFLTLFPSIQFYVMYGQTEAAARLSFLSPAYIPQKIGSIGKGIPGVILEICDEQGSAVKSGTVGEIVAGGKNIMMGYWNDPEETKAVLKNNRLFTGDLARIDEDGFIYIEGRKKDMIKIGANRVGPLEIEHIVSQHPHVLECAAVGVPDEILGEAVKLFIVGNGIAAIDTNEIMLFCKKHMAFYKLPKEIEIIAQLPKTSTGKIIRRQLTIHKP